MIQLVHAHHTGATDSLRDVLAVDDLGQDAHTLDDLLVRVEERGVAVRGQTQQLVDDFLTFLL